jgi:hypothetical protein
MSIVYRLEIFTKTRAKSCFLICPYILPAILIQPIYDPTDRNRYRTGRSRPVFFYPSLLTECLSARLPSHSRPILSIVSQITCVSGYLRQRGTLDIIIGRCLRFLSRVSRSPNGTFVHTVHIVQPHGIGNPRLRLPEFTERLGYIE